MKRSKSKNRIKPRGTVEHHGKSTVPPLSQEIDELQVATWCPDAHAKLPPEQVHLNIRMKHSPIPLTMRFFSPDTLGFLIQELAEYRREVWGDSAKLNIEPL